MRANPTPQQRRALDTLGYFAPLLRLMRCEVARVVWTVGQDRHRRTSAVLLGPGHIPPGIRDEIVGAALGLVAHWLVAPEDEAAVNFDTVSGLVDVHRHNQPGYTSIQFWVDLWDGDHPPRFTQPLAPLLTGTLTTGGEAVLADWFDEQTEDWSTLATVLRTWGSFTLRTGHHVDGFRFIHTSPDTACWPFRVGDEWTTVDGENEVWVVGLGVFGPEGLERAWHFSSTKPLDPVFAAQFWALCPAPPRGSA